MTSKRLASVEGLSNGSMSARYPETKTRASSKFLGVLSILILYGCASSGGSEVRISIGGSQHGTVIYRPVTSAQEIKWTNVSRQTLDISCGPAALATILNYYLGDRVSEIDIISSILQSSDPAKINQIQKRQAFSLLDLKRYAVAKGYSAEGYAVGFQDLVDFGKPVIIAIEPLGYKHFVVFRGISGDRVYLADPAFGNITMRFPHFFYAWKERVALVITSRGRENIDHALGLGRADGVYVKGPTERLLARGFIDFISRGDF
jgi:predicted double-glycine peptidase